MLASEWVKKHAPDEIATWTRAVAPTAYLTPGASRYLASGALRAGLPLNTAYAIGVDKKYDFELGAPAEYPIYIGIRMQEGHAHAGLGALGVALLPLFLAASPGWLGATGDWALYKYVTTDAGGAPLSSAAYLERIRKEYLKPLGGGGPGLPEGPSSPPALG